MEPIIAAELIRGRRFLVRLSIDEDLIRAVEDFCRRRSIELAAFTVRGSVSSVTIGCYDQKQQVYVTNHEETPYELLACFGNVSRQDATPCAHAHGVLADANGVVTGGRLFSDTVIFAAELDLQELIGKPLERAYDPQTGMMLWKQD
jgi:predicted DNA-binding protein with PD1-like motif